MGFSSIKEWTPLEAVALAFVEFEHKRFTSNQLATHLCAILSEPFKVRSVTQVNELLQIAAAENLVQQTPGPRGGPGYQVSELGAGAVAEVALPREKFEHRAALDNEKMMQANANPGPVFTKLLSMIPTGKFRDRNFIESLAQYWLLAQEAFTGR